MPNPVSHNGSLPWTAEWFRQQPRAQQATILAEAVREVRADGRAISPALLALARETGLSGHIASFFARDQVASDERPSVLDAARRVPAETPLEERYPLGEPLASGAQKQVYAVAGRDDVVIAILKPSAMVDHKPNQPDMLEKERHNLALLAARGLPVVEVIDHGHNREGLPAIIYRRYATGSKEPADKLGRFFNRTTMKQARDIIRGLNAAHIYVKDLQLLIGADGRAVISDPMEVEQLRYVPDGLFANRYALPFMKVYQAFAEAHPPSFWQRVKSWVGGDA